MKPNHNSAPRLKRQLSKDELCSESTLKRQFSKDDLFLNKEVVLYTSAASMILNKTSVNKSPLLSPDIMHPNHSRAMGFFLPSIHTGSGRSSTTTSLNTLSSNSSFQSLSVLEDSRIVSTKTSDATTYPIGVKGDLDDVASESESTRSYK